MTKTQKSDATTKTVECAVRLDCPYGKHDDIIELPANEALSAFEAGLVDTHPNAVAAIRRGQAQQEPR